MQGTSVRLAHVSPGRIRLKVDELKGNARRAREIEGLLRTVSGILSVEASHITGSLLLTYVESALELMEMLFSVAQILGISLNDLDPDELRRLMSPLGSESADISIAEGLEAAVQDMNTALRRTVGADLAFVAPVLLGLVGVRSLFLSEKTVVPSWYDYLWFAFSSYFMLNRTSATRQADSDR